MIILLRALRALFPLLRLRPWLLALMIGVGILAALSERGSISLYVPLVQSQFWPASGGLIGK